MVIQIFNTLSIIHLYGISAIWIDSVHTARCDTILIKQSTTFGFCQLAKNVAYSAYLMSPSKSSRSTLNETLPELAFQISEAIFVGRPISIEINKAVQTSLKNSPTSTVRVHVAQHLHGISAIWIDSVHTARCDTILIKQSTTFGFCQLAKNLI